MRCYIDYTCRYSYRAWRWFSRLGVSVEWRTFSLKEVNLDPGEPSAFDDLGSRSILALALAHAAREHDFPRYHAAAFEAFHERQVEEDDLLGFARDAGVDVEKLDREELFARAADEHLEAADRWNVFGTPTLIMDDSAVFLRLKELPPESDDEATWNSILTLARSPVDLLEIMR